MYAFFPPGPGDTSKAYWDIPLRDIIKEAYEDIPTFKVGAAFQVP